jgi:hypothetical protein
MSEELQDFPQDAYSALKSSGFPLQTRIRHLINPSRGWVVDASEFPWQTANGEDEYLDLVATNRGTILGIECKKSNEVLTFLRPLDSPTGYDFSCRCLCVRRPQSGAAPEIYCETWQMKPQSRTSEFCVSTKKPLEADAAHVVRATEAYAVYYKWALETGAAVRVPVLLIPVIVTSARLYTVRYGPDDVSLDTGEFLRHPGEKKFESEEAPWVRFRKTFTAARGADLGDRTVFIVRAASLSDFLLQLELEAGAQVGEGSVPVPLARRR